MTDSRDRARLLGPGMAVVPLALVLVACAAPAPTAESEVPSASAPPTISATAGPSPEATALEFPAVVDGEVARAEFVTVGPSGVPENRSVAEDAVTAGPYAVEGACNGTRAAYRLTTAAVGQDERQVLTEGTMDCADPYRSTFAVAGYEGVVQQSFTDTDRVDAGWLRVVPATAS